MQVFSVHSIWLKWQRRFSNYYLDLCIDNSCCFWMYLRISSTHSNTDDNILEARISLNRSLYSCPWGRSKRAHAFKSLEFSGQILAFVYFVFPSASKDEFPLKFIPNRYTVSSWIVHTILPLHLFYTYS